MLQIGEGLFLPSSDLWEAFLFSEEKKRNGLHGISVTFSTHYKNKFMSTGSEHFWQDMSPPWGTLHSKGTEVVLILVNQNIILYSTPRCQLNKMLIWLRRYHTFKKTWLCLRDKCLTSWIYLQVHSIQWWL